MFRNTMNQSVKTALKKQKTRGGVFYFVLTSCFFSFLTLFAPCTLANSANHILLRVGNHVFTQTNADELIQLGEFLGRSGFTREDKQQLTSWSIADFKSAPEQSVAFYDSLHKEVLPRIAAQDSDIEIYRAELYLRFIRLFNRHPEYQKSPHNFLAIIDHYHPPVTEAMQLQQLQHNLVMQQIQMNQRLFNQTLQQAQQSSAIITKEIIDSSRRSAITLPGGKIIQETDNVIYAEDSQGRKFEVLK